MNRTRANLCTHISRYIKNNIKLLSPRAAELFSKLPDPIKIILGDQLDEEKWNEIRDSGMVPAYQCCGSGIRDWVLFDPWIRDPGSGIGFFRIPDLGSRIPDPKTIFLRAF